MSTFARTLSSVAAGAFFIACLGVFGTAGAAIVPDTIGYEGFLRDKGGTADPVSGTANLTFRIYDEASGANAPLWTESHTSVAVTNGVFSVQLGSISKFRDANLTFDRALWVSLQVDAIDGTPPPVVDEMAPRLALNASPYAFSARAIDATVSIDCGADADALHKVLDDAIDATRLTIDISGNCNGNILIDRDRVTLKSSDNTGRITGLDVAFDYRATVAVTGSNVVIENVDVIGFGTGTNEHHGVLVLNNGEALLRGSDGDNLLIQNHSANGLRVMEASALDVFWTTVEGNAWSGVAAALSSHADVSDSIVQNNGGHGLDTWMSASLDIRRSIIQDNTEHGVLSNGNSSVRIAEGTTIQNNGDPGNLSVNASGLIINENSHARVEDSTITTTRPHGSAGAAIGVLRGSNLRLRGTNTITASATGTADCPPDCPYGDDEGGMALDVEMNSFVRQDGGKTTITGNIYTYNQSSLDMRDMEATGTYFHAAGLQCNLRMRDQSAGADLTPSFTGTVAASGSCEFNIRDSGSSQRAIIDGKVWCRNPDIWVSSNLAFANPADPSNGYVNCGSVNADLTINLVETSGNSNVGDTLTYSMTVTNTATTPQVEALNVNANVQFGGPMVWSGGWGIDSVSDGNCNQNGDNVQCNWNLLLPGEVKVVTFNVNTGDQAGQLDAYGNLNARNPDPDFNSNSSNVMTNLFF